MKDILFELCTANGVSGNENQIAQIAKQTLEPYCKVTKDNFGNIIATAGNPDGKKTILLDAHIDQIGLIVTYIEDNGFLRVAKCGGVDARTLQGSAVIVHGKKDILGIVCCMPPHLTNDDENTAISIDEVLIDTGLSTEQLGEVISIGDVITFYNHPKELLSERVLSPSLDNRAGVAALIECAKLIYDKKTDYNVVIMLSRQEETYASGAKTGAFSIKADESIVVDVSFALQPDISNYTTAGKLGGGSMICVSAITDKFLTNKLIDIAKSNNINYQIEVCSGRTGTNADHISVTKSGIKTALLSIPQRYMHTQGEVVDLTDIKDTANIISQYILQGGISNE